MTYVLGVDGGTSKTKALIARPDGTIVGHGHSAGSNIYEGDPQVGLENGMEAPTLALRDAALQPEDLTTSVFSMSGADWPEDMLLFRSIARARSLGKRIEVVNDAIGGLRAGLPALRAVGIICGTHTACAARGNDGRYWHASFWQHAGAAHDLGSAALRAIYQSDLGIDPPTALTEAILTRFDASSAEELLHRHTALIAQPLVGIAELAPLVLDLATGGDCVALEIVRRQGNELARYALAAARKVGIEQQTYDVVLGGSVFRHSSSLLPDVIIGAMRRQSPEITVVRRQHEPVFGALLLALEEHSVIVDDTVIERIVETLPDGWY